MNWFKKKDKQKLPTKIIYYLVENIIVKGDVTLIFNDSKEFLTYIDEHLESADCFIDQSGKSYIVWGEVVLILQNEEIQERLLKRLKTINKKV